jgi:hypothetical protein
MLPSVTHFAYVLSAHVLFLHHFPHFTDPHFKSVMLTWMQRSQSVG